jgi:hypothetical protein
MDHSIIPEQWKKFLRTIQTLFPDAIIAGGALRDTIIDNVVKDVDIFISDRDVKIEDIAALFNLKVIFDLEEIDNQNVDCIKLSHDIKLLKMMAAAKFPVSDKRHVNVESLGNKSLLESFITQIFDIKYKGTIYQLIFVEQDPIKMVYNDFDFGICKVWYNGEDFVISDEFWYDLENKQLTISGKFSMGQMIHTLFVHRNHLVKKFPNWKVVIDDLSRKTDDDMPPSYKKILADSTPIDERGYALGLAEWKDHCRKQGEEFVKSGKTFSPQETLTITSGGSVMMPSVRCIDDLPEFIPSGDGTIYFVKSANQAYVRSQGKWIAMSPTPATVKKQYDPGADILS